MAYTQVYLDLSEAKALGDTICSTPIIKKLFDSYQRKINVISVYPELFDNNMYVFKSYHANNIDINEIKDKYIYHNSFHNVGKANEFGVEYKHNNIDIRQFHAIQLGFMLGAREMCCYYKPNEYEPIENLPEKYVLIHPVQTWPSRTWSARKWIELTQKLNDVGISVVSIGKDSSETGFFNITKPTFNFEIPNGLNLMNKTSISQAWHVIEKSSCFVTMDSGLLHLAGTTSANILILRSSIKPEFRIPYRDGGSQEYRTHLISGTCKLDCASDMKYGVKEWGNIQGIPPLIGCLENKMSFECHPTVNQVFNKIIENQKGKIK
jgi:ADP-heptose:LPS heptosyltransferase